MIAERKAVRATSAPWPTPWLKRSGAWRTPGRSLISSIARIEWRPVHTGTPSTRRRCTGGRARCGHSVRRCAVAVSSRDHWSARRSATQDHGYFGADRRFVCRMGASSAAVHEPILIAAAPLWRGSLRASHERMCQRSRDSCPVATRTARRAVPEALSLRQPSGASLAEGEGFGLANLAPINSLGPFSSARSARNAENPNRRYKTGTVEPPDTARHPDASLRTGASGRRQSN